MLPSVELLHRCNFGSSREEKMSVLYEVFTQQYVQY